MSSGSAGHRLVAASRITVGGYWGQMLALSCRNWMLHVSDDLLLDGFRKRPGIQAWIGEHWGKYLLGAIPTSRLLKSAELTAKVDRLCEALPAFQEPVGYLGTYLPADRWSQDGSGWDPWVHKYCILALLADHAVTGRKRSLAAATAAADAVISQFGPGRKNINACGCHSGLASGSILEAIMLLYQRTGQERFLDFGRYVLRAWSEPDGPGVITHLSAGHTVNYIANAKAYEMMSCFVGLAEYGRASGQAEYLPMLLEARDRIAEGHRLPTGAMSRNEYFRPSGMLEEDAAVETCVTFTWIQLNLRLFEITGDARALDLAEEAAWNQLLPALSPRGDAWSYFLPLTGPKSFAAHWVQGVDITYPGSPITCCHTNGQRGLALLPQYAYTVTAHGELAVNFYGAFRADIDLPSGPVTIEQETDFPASGRVTIRVRCQGDKPFDLLLRRPDWTEQVTVDGRQATAENGRIRMPISGSRSIELELGMTPRLILCGLGARGKCAVAYGPLVMSMEQPPEGLALDQVAIDLGSNDWRAEVRTHVENGWPALEVPFASLPAQAVADSSRWRSLRGMMRLRPIVLAGLQGNRTLTESLTDREIPRSTDQIRQSFLPEYRVLLPYFWQPH